MRETLRFLLLQVRDPDDPMREQEVACFVRALDVDPGQIAVFDLLRAAPTRGELDRFDMVLLGGSGRYSVARSEGEWIERTLDGLREIHRLAKPTFASCWGFQAMARAMGGRVVHDLERAEVGTHTLRLTEAGRADPLFGPLGESFRGQMGHEDRVAELPPGATLLASSSRVENQAYRFDGRPIYATQFHPELNREDLLGRVRTYPEYIHRIADVSIEKFEEFCEDTPEAEALLRRFLEQVFDC